jgi:tRNA A-37 threonylcarbamoyl transferase component Bud32
MVTEALPNTTDLADLARTGDARLRDSAWVRNVSHQLAMITHTLHAHRFAHNDLKWRNVLVDTDSHVFLIDCPLGRHLHQPFLEPRKRKDLATLDKVAKQALRGSQRLRFFLDYLGKTSLDAADKRSLRTVLRYFEGRE